MAPSESYRREVTERVGSGWRIEEETPDRVTLVGREFGDPGLHIIVAVFTIWWTMGVANLLHAAYKYFTASQGTVVWKHPASETGETTAATGAA